eukprot:CAMPEP_0179202718 /NCGR_PEP_ID=MMETSP0796-20121207/100994_1 /TAXON_ID=73915 /ORGANISM="Pyrodinium bahamense, Strain pbaha01" /LENGTH=57 /DNA_ID=CAMNT_0020907477 /DNA_START=19 /DNA_END=190 /DNA_ORIENTATION=+
MNSDAFNFCAAQVPGGSNAASACVFVVPGASPPSGLASEVFASRMGGPPKWKDICRR